MTATARVNLERLGAMLYSVVCSSRRAMGLVAGRGRRGGCAFMNSLIGCGTLAAFCMDAMPIAISTRDRAAPPRACGLALIFFVPSAAALDCCGRHTEQQLVSYSLLASGPSCSSTLQATRNVSASSTRAHQAASALTKVSVSRPSPQCTCGPGKLRRAAQDCERQGSRASACSCTPSTCA